MIIGHSNREKGYKVYNISDIMTITNGEPDAQAINII